MMCPNCKTPCVGCAGAKIVKASNGATVCTKCLPLYESGLRPKPNNSISPNNMQATYTPPKQ